MTLVDLDGEPKAPKGFKTTLVNQCGENIPISYKLRKKNKPLIMMLISSPTLRMKCYGEM